MVILCLPGGLTLGHDPEDALHEVFAEAVTAVVGVGLGEFVTVAGEAVVASLPGEPVLVPPEVGLALGAVVAADGLGVFGAGVVFEALARFATTGFSVGDATTLAGGGLFNPKTLRFALLTLAKRFLSTSVKVLSLLKPVSSPGRCLV